MRTEPEAAKSISKGEYKRRGCPSEKVRWNFATVHRFICAHLDRLTREGLSPDEDWGVMAADLPLHKDGRPAPLPSWVLDCEARMQKEVKKLADKPAVREGYKDSSFQTSLKLVWLTGNSPSLV